MHLARALVAAGVALLVVNVGAASKIMPDACASITACMSGMAAGDTLTVRDGTYSAAVTDIKAGVVVQAEHDGKATLSGAFNPGSAGFTMRGFVLKSSNQKDLGAGNRYERMSFVGGPPCGNNVNTLTGRNTTIAQAMFYGRGGRYLLLAYQQIGGIVLTDVVFRPDGGWGTTASCADGEPQAAYNLYDSEGVTVTRALVFDAITDSAAEVLGGHVVNTHQGHGTVGTISQSIITTSPKHGRFASDGAGSHSLTIVDSVARGNGYEWGLTRNVAGTTTATRFDTDAKVGAFKGSINRTAGAQVVLNAVFLNDARWRVELCAGVSRGWCATSQTLSAYVASRAGIPDGGTPTGPPAAPTGLKVLP